MLKKIIQVSSLVFTLAMASGMSANAASLGANEEDTAAPPGSFTSAMEIPAGRHFDLDARRMRHERLVMRFSNEQSAADRASRQDSDQRK